MRPSTAAAVLVGWLDRLDIGCRRCPLFLVGYCCRWGRTTDWVHWEAAVGQTESTERRRLGRMMFLPMTFQWRRCIPGSRSTLKSLNMRTKIALKVVQPRRQHHVVGEGKCFFLRPLTDASNRFLRQLLTCWLLIVAYCCRVWLIRFSDNSGRPELSMRSASWLSRAWICWLRRWHYFTNWSQSWMWWSSRWRKWAKP